MKGLTLDALTRECALVNSFEVTGFNPSTSTRRKCPYSIEKERSGSLSKAPATTTSIYDLANSASRPRSTKLSLKNHGPWLALTAQKYLKFREGTPPRPISSKDTCRRANSWTPLTTVILLKGLCDCHGQRQHSSRHEGSVVGPDFKNNKALRDKAR